MLPEIKKKKRYAVVITPACRNEFHENGDPIFWQPSLDVTHAYLLNRFNLRSRLRRSDERYHPGVSMENNDRE